MKKEKKEIRDVLMGKTVLDEDGCLTTLEPGMFRVPQGVMDGAGGVFLLGIARRSRVYETAYSREDTLAWADQRMMELGRVVRLRTQPDTAACRIRYVLTRPAMLTFRFVGGQAVLTAWAGRGLTAWISLGRALRAFEQQLPEGIRPSREALPREKKERKDRGRKAQASPAPEQETWAEQPPYDTYGAEAPEQGNWAEQPPYDTETPGQEDEQA